MLNRPILQLEPTSLCVEQSDEVHGSAPFQDLHHDSLSSCLNKLGVKTDLSKGHGHSDHVRKEDLLGNLDV